MQKHLPVDCLFKSIVWFAVSNASFPRTLLISVLDRVRLCRQAHLHVVFVGLTLLTLTLTAFQCRASLYVLLGITRYRGARYLQREVGVLP